MRVPAVPVFLALLAGGACAFVLPAWAMPWLAAAALAAWQLALVALVASRLLLFAAAALASIALSAGAAGLHEDALRRHAPVRTLAPPPGIAPRGDVTLIEGIVMDDAAVSGETVSLRVRVTHASVGGMRLPLAGGVSLSVGGEPDAARWGAWTRGRRVALPAALRRPSRYVNDGVADGELASLRRGIALVGSVKSAALVDVTARASPLQERLARLRARVRASIAAALAHDPEAAAIVTAILIGDRAGLSDEVETRLQRAGTYHVIAISGGNIALFALLAWGVARVVAGARRPAIVAAMAMVAGYGLLVGTGASVARAVIAALLFLAATLAGHRAPPLNVLAGVGALFLVWDPLALADVGFLLSFGATAGILLAAPAMIGAFRAGVGLDARGGSRAGRIALAAAAMVAATVAAEIVLLPVQAAAFQRVTVAGLVLNLIAIPAMSLVQIAGIALLACDAAGAGPATAASAAVAAAAAHALTGSALLVDVVPRLSWRVASPPPWLWLTYTLVCAALAWARLARLRRALAAAACALAAAMLLSAGAPPLAPARLVLTMFDVGQAEAMALRLPSGHAFQIDAAGPPGRFDIAGRVLVPALLARGIHRLDALIVTHPDLDHVGGGLGVLADMRPSRVIEGIAPARHPERDALALAARAAGLTVEALRAGGSIAAGAVRINVLHPPPPEWERQRVRNDDSLALEVVYGHVSLILTGDAGEEGEGRMAGQLAPAPLRILKAGHHGSRTSTSSAFLDAVRPSAALISAGRGNVYGHPAPAVTRRLEARGAAVFRTDRDGQIDVITDGRSVEIVTKSGRRWQIAARAPLNGGGG